MTTHHQFGSCTVSRRTLPSAPGLVQQVTQAMDDRINYANGPGGAFAQTGTVRFEASPLSFWTGLHSISYQVHDRAIFNMLPRT
jgi:hypothetical protein